MNHASVTGLKGRSLVRRLLHPARMFVWRCEDYVSDRLAPFQRCLSRSFFATSIPKGGTHLLMGVLQKVPQLSRRPLRLPSRHPLSEYKRLLGGLAKNRFAFGHMGATQPIADLIRTFGLSVIVMVRDPRDIIVSFMEHVSRRPHDLKSYHASLSNDQERLRMSIIGVPSEAYPRLPQVDVHGGYDMLVGFTDIGTVCRSFLAWKKQPDMPICWVRFEDLVGVRGGGSEEAQRQAVSSILRFLGLEDDEQLLLRNLCAEAYNPRSITFNKGQVGRWREFFTPKLKDLFKEIAGRELIEMGYEKDANW